MGVKKVAIVGAGAMAREHIKALKTFPDVEVSGIYSRTAEKAQKLAKEFDIPTVCDSLDTLYQQTKSDFVIITVNVLDIAPVILACAKHPWKILAEKPAGHHYREALDLYKNLSSKAEDVYVALNRRFLSSSLHAKEQLNKTSSRRIVEISDQQSLSAAASSGHPAEVVKYWMYANSIHLVDLANYFCRGGVNNVTHIKKWYGEDTDFVLSHVEYDSGDEALYRCYFKQSAPWSVSIATDQVRYELRPLEKLSIQKVNERAAAEIKQNQYDIDYKPGFVAQMHSFLTHHKNAITLKEANISMELVNKIYGV